LRLTS